MPTAKANGGFCRRAQYSHCFTEMTGSEAQLYLTDLHAILLQYSIINRLLYICVFSALDHRYKTEITLSGMGTKRLFFH